MKARDDQRATPGVRISPEVPFVGRKREREELRSALTRTQAGTGSAWILEGPGGIGKTRLVRWIQEIGNREGFHTPWGYALKDVNTTFFPFQQIFRTRAEPAGRTPEEGSEGTLGSPVIIFEEDRPQAIFGMLDATKGSAPGLILARDRPETLRARHPNLPSSALLRWLSKGEGPEKLSPADIDTIGNVIEEHFRAAQGSWTVITGIEYLIAQNNFPAVLRLVQFLRDCAEEHGGSVLLSINPETLDKRELSLLEGEGDVRRTQAPAAPTVAPPETAVATMIRYLETLEHDSASRPQLLLVDDLQWADPDSLRAFQFLARNVLDLRVMLLATVRTDEVRSPSETGEITWMSILDDMEREGTAHRMVLPGLNAKEAAELVQGIFGVPLAAGAQDATLLSLLEQSGGNTYFILETLRQLAETGQVRVGDQGLVWNSSGGGGDGPQFRVPESLRRLVARRLEALPDPDLDLLRWAAVAGSEFDSEPLAGILPLPRGTVEQAILRLEREERLLEKPEEGPRGPRWSFGHPLVWEVVMGEISEEDMARRALRLGDWWAASRPQDVETITRLYHEARHPAKGLAWVRKALEAALRNRALEPSERFHRWLQELLLLSGAETDVRVREGLTVALHLLEFLGPSPETERILRSLLAQHPSRELLWEIEAALASTLASTSVTDAVRLIDELRREWTGLEGVELRLQGLVGVAAARAAASQAREENVESEGDRVLALGEGLPTWIEAQAAYYSGGASAHRGAFDKARERLRLIERLAARGRNPRLLSNQASLEMFIAEATGEALRQVKASEVRLELSREIGNPWEIALALSNLCGGYLVAGDIESAKRVVVEFRQFTNRFHIEYAETLVQIRDADNTLHEGRGEEARRMFESLEEKMLGSGNVELLLSMQLNLANAYLALGDLTNARREITLMRSSGRAIRASELLNLYMLEGRCDLFEGLSEESRQHFEEAVKLAHTLGNRLHAGTAEMHLALWEDAFGTADAAKRYRAGAHAKFLECGLRPSAWEFNWPPPLSKAIVPKEGTRPSPPPPSP